MLIFQLSVLLILLIFVYSIYSHLDYKWALPDQMAQAGFYHQSSETGDDRAMCFTCPVCLVCWEKTDEPWSEHERHSPDCPFLKGEYTQNVPLSVTYATNPSIETDGFELVSSGDNGNICCTGKIVSGDVIVWNVERMLKKCGLFNIKSCEKLILNKYDVEDDLNTKLTALCTFKKQNVFKVKEPTCAEKTKISVNGTRIIAGVKCKWSGHNEKENPSFEQEQCVGSKKEFLVVYAVTEPQKVSTKPKALGKTDSPLLTILESSHEERFEGFEGLLKFINIKEPTAQTANNELMFNPSSSVIDNWSNIINDKADSFNDMDAAKSLPMNGVASSGGSNKNVPVKSRSDDVVCVPIQTVEIPKYLFDDYEIREILPSYDNRHLLVVLKRSKEKSDDEIVFMDTDQNEDDSFSPKEYPFVHLLLYAVDDNGLIRETPVCQRLLGPKDTPSEICMLPKFDTNGKPSSSGSLSGSGAFVMTCVDGSIKVLSIATLKTVSEAKVEGQNFVSSVYCKNLERLCGCTDTGMLHFYSFYDLDIDSSDELDDESNEIITPIPDNVPSTSTAPPKVERQSSDIIAHRQELNEADLKSLFMLTQFDPMLTPYSAEVPGCWTELVQAQKQRRQPQHLNPGEDTHLSRTWRLHNDAMTWDEHLIELSLTKPISIGHIDFRFSILQPCTNPPAIQVTLLKQKSIGLCCRRKNKSDPMSRSYDVDDNINYNLNSGSPSSSAFGFAVENPVLSDEYLQARNAEILAGPVDLSSCMDLNEQGGTVTLSSPKLMKSKARNYLLHIKTMADVSKEGHNKMRGECRKFVNFYILVHSMCLFFVTISLIIHHIIELLQCFSCI